MDRSALDPTSPLLTPAIFGGDGQVKEVAAACAGTFGLGDRADPVHPHACGVGEWRPRAELGPLRQHAPDRSTLAWSRGDGVEWAYVINTRDWPPNTSPTLDDLGTNINHLLDTTPLP